MRSKAIQAFSVLALVLGALFAPLASANAAPVYADTSVSVSGFSFIDMIAATPVLSTAFNPVVGTTFTLGATPGGGTWTPQTTALNGLTFTLNGTGAASIAGTPTPATGGTTQFEASVSNAGGAVSKATVTVSWTSTTTATYTVTADDVTLPHATTNNVTGNVDVPAASIVTETLSNAPSGVALSGDSITATNAIPGTYHNLKVTGTDAAGSTAVETLSVLVKGNKVHATVPVLSQGHAVCLSATREDVYFVQSGVATWDHFEIVGPGAINGHEGWVNGHLGLNFGFYAGLEAHHGYEVYYTPVTGQGSTTPYPGAHTGHVYFKSDTNC